MDNPLLTLARTSPTGATVEVAEIRYDKGHAAVSLWRAGTCVDVKVAVSVGEAATKAATWRGELEREGFVLVHPR